MLHNCSHALGDNSNPIDGHRWSIDAHRKKLRWPSMGFDGPIDGIEWSLSTGDFDAVSYSWGNNLKKKPLLQAEKQEVIVITLL